MKQIIPKYTFNAAAKTITFTAHTTLAKERLALITNTTTGTIIYQFNDVAKGGTFTGNVLTLTYDTTSMSNTDKLRIDYDAISGEPVFDRLVVGNAQQKFRDGFASTGVSQPDPAVWALTNDATDPITGHIITQGGNSSGSSYLRISLSPFFESSGVVLNSVNTFDFPMRVGFGLSMSQRVLGQEAFIGMVGADSTGAIEYTASLADIAISGATASITTNVATFTITNHGLSGGDRINIFGCAEKRLNVGPVVVTVLTKDTFTVPCTLANGSYSTVGGYVRTIHPLRYAKNGAGLLVENVTATNASFVSRRNGAKFRSLNSTVGTTVATQTSTSPFTDSFNATSSHELYYSMDEVSYRSFAADGVATMNGLAKWSQNIPDEELDYKIQIRTRNLNGLTVPVGRITSIAKTGTTTATVTTDVPHGLVANDWVQVYGVRDQTNFPNLVAQTVVGTVPTSTTFTVIIGSATTTSSLGGIVYQNQGSVLAPGIVNTAIQSISRTDNVLTVIGSATMATLLPGEYVQLHGLEAAASAYEGAYKVVRVATTTLELESVGADFTSITTGGAVIKRTDVRLHYTRVMDYTRLVTEIVGGRGNTTDINNSVPVSITGGAALSVTATQTTGVNTTTWNAAGFSGFLVNDIVSAAITSTATTAAVTPGIVANLGVHSHVFNVAVTVVSGTNPTMDIAVEESPDNGTNWVRIYEFPRITATGSYNSPMIPNKLGTRYRYVRTIAGTTPSFTTALNRNQYSIGAPFFRQWIDRSITLTTLNSVTPSFVVDGAKDIFVGLSLSTAVTQPQVQLEGSEDNGTTWYAIGSPLVGVASTVAVANNLNIPTRLVRVRVSTAGVTLGTGNNVYVMVKATGA